MVNHSLTDRRAWNIIIQIVDTMSTGTAERWNRGTFSLVRTLMHFVGAISFWYGIHYFSSEVKFPATTGFVQFGGKFKFLTFLNAVNMTEFSFYSYHHSIYIFSYMLMIMVGKG